MTTTLKRCQFIDGFIPIGPVDNIVSMPLAAVSVSKGDMLIDDGNGYLTNASITGFAAETAYYVALEPVDNSAGSVGDLDILCVYANGANIEFWAPAEDAAPERTDVGTILDLNSEDGVKTASTVTNTGIGFLVTGFDIGTAALAANTYGYVKGRFHILGETT